MKFSFFICLEKKLSRAGHGCADVSD